MVAAQLLQPGPSSSDLITKIHQKTTSKYTEELRDELFSSESGGFHNFPSLIFFSSVVSLYSIHDLRILPPTDGTKAIRQRKSSKVSSGEDLDVLLRHHQAMQEKIAEDMLSLARNLKEQSHLASTIIKRDTEVSDCFHLYQKQLATIKLNLY